MRVLHVVKTSEGAFWAAREVAELVNRGVEAHVALPSGRGSAMAEWRRSGARIHICQLDFPARAPWQLPSACRTVRELVEKVRPDLIHTHFVGNTLLVRMALGKRHPIPRVFQVPGPLHLEHPAVRSAELATAGPHDSWIATSRYIAGRYRRAGVAPTRVFLSYHGGSASEISPSRTHALRSRLGIRDDQYVIGNINFMYPPRPWLGQKSGIKRHEQVIDALGLVLKKRPDVVGVLVGGVFGGDPGYEEELRLRARATGGGRIRLPGRLSGSEIAAAWADFDCAVHIPLSENCGGVLEPLLAGVPTIAARVGGLPEVVADGVTGHTVSGGDPEELAAAALEVLRNLSHARSLAANGRALVERMFDVRRTAGEVHAIYRHLREPSHPRPEEFNSLDVMREISECAVAA